MGWVAIGLTIVFIGWILYRLFIKKDLSKNLNNLYFGLFFVAIWLSYYFFIITVF
jgi:high-affinity Fe2+/Pb2+ permease